MLFVEPCIYTHIKQELKCIINFNNNNNSWLAYISKGCFSWKNMAQTVSVRLFCMMHAIYLVDCHL